MPFQNVTAMLKINHLVMFWVNGPIMIFFLDLETMFC